MAACPSTHSGLLSYSLAPTESTFGVLGHPASVTVDSAVGRHACCVAGAVAALLCVLVGGTCTVSAVAAVLFAAGTSCDGRVRSVWSPLSCSWAVFGGAGGILDTAIPVSKANLAMVMMQAQQRDPCMLKMAGESTRAGAFSSRDLGQCV